MYDSRAIANRLLEIAWNDEVSLTKMQLIKLVYLVHGWSLAFLGRSLIEDRPQAWKLGPVYPRLYKKLSGYTSQPINKLILDASTNLPYSLTFQTQGERDLVNQVASSYSEFDAFTLSDMTHKSGTPWSNTYKNGDGVYENISEDDIAQYYNHLKVERGLDDQRYDY